MAGQICFVRVSDLLPADLLPADPDVSGFLKFGETTRTGTKSADRPKAGGLEVEGEIHSGVKIIGGSGRRSIKWCEITMLRFLLPRRDV